MSSGHHKSGDEWPDPVAEGRYRQAMADPEFQKVLGRAYVVNRQYPIPYLGGYSKDGKTIYIDKNFSLVRLIPALVEHEHWEKTVLEAWGLTYLPAHRIALVAEHKLVQSQLHMTPTAYENKLKPYIQDDVRDPKSIRLPPDLDRTPYKGSKWE